MKLTQTTAPTTTAVSLAEARAWLNMTPGITEDDAVLELLIDEAVDYLEHRTNRKLLAQTWTLQLDWSEVSECIRLPLVPLVSVSSIKTTDDDGVETTVTSTNYQVRAGEDPRIVLTSDGEWPSDARDYDAMAIVCVCGYAGTVVPYVGFEPASAHVPGLNDMTAGLSAAWSGTARTVFEVKITTADTTDKFDWRSITSDSNGQKTYGAWTADVAIDGTAQALATGATVRFSNNTGHTLNDQWTVEMYERLPERVRHAIRGCVLHFHDSKGRGVSQTVSGQLYSFSHHLTALFDSLRVHPF